MFQQIHGHLLAQWQRAIDTQGYREVKRTEIDIEEQTALQQETYYQQGDFPRTTIASCCLFFAKITFLASYAFLLLRFWSEKSNGICIHGNEKIFDDVPVISETLRFQRAGFHDSHHASDTVYEGSPNSENNAAWEHLLKVGVVTISKEENSRLVNGSASLPNNGDKHFVELEVFHQLHCLKWLRDQFWTLWDGATTGSIVKFEPQQSNHTDHCIDYLRQAIMCHGDVTPISFEYNEEIQGLLAHHTTEHQCRNFDAIYEWAERRDTSGVNPNGHHMNVELSRPEMFD